MSSKPEKTRGANKTLGVDKTVMIVFLIIAFVFFLIMAILSGKVMGHINKSACTTDPSIKEAHKRTAWMLGINIVGALFAIGAFLAILLNKI